MRSEALLAAAIDRQPTAVFIVRLDGDNVLMPPIVYVNQAFCELTGYSKEEITAGTYPRMMGPLTDRVAIEDAAYRVRGGENVVTEVVLYHRSGREFWTKVHAHPIDMDDGPHGVLILEDVTAQRERESRLALLDEAVDQASDFVIVTDMRPHSEGAPRLLYVNRAFLAASGYEKDELIGKPYTLIYSPNNDPASMASLRANIDAGKPNYREILAVRKDGSEFWIEFVAKPFESQGETYRLSIGRDITLRKRAFNQIALLLSALEQSPHRVVLYEPNPQGELALSYENEPATKASSYRALRLWQSDTDLARSFRERLLRGETVQQVYHEDIEGAPALVELVARGVRNGVDIGAILTTERVLAHAVSAGGSFQSKLIVFARLLPALSEATSTQERFAVLRALLLDAFEAEVRDVGFASAVGVHIAPGSRVAHFSYGERAYVATWPLPLDHASITAVRFCIEAAIEQEALGIGHG